MLMFKTLSRFCLLLSLIVSSGCYYANGVVYDPQKAHHGDDGFISTKQSSFIGHWMMRWREDPPPPRDPLAIKNIEIPADIELINSPADQPRVTWIGHATSLVQYKDINYLTDPHLTQYPFYFEMFIDPRYTQPALTFEEMPDIDFIVISHNHYDHLDHRTVDLFGNSVMWYVPLGLKNWFLDRGISPDRVVELDWWESQQFSEDVEITFTPNEHWSKRTPWDTNQSLWGSWAVNIAGFKSWYAGDTGYHKSYFREIGNRLGPFRLAMIPIGAYAPRYFMELAHVDPAQAIDIHRDIQSQQSVPVHWGTFQLTIEPALEPPKLLREEMALRNLSIEAFEPIKIGQTLILD
jgi:N-acyl-phosphatidylethanolamine-hydrolysing phospholipase D